MKAFGYFVIILITPAFPQVHSGCAVPSATSRHVWYVDPVQRKTPAAGGNGSQASPWNSLSGVLSGSWAPTSQYLATVENGSVVENVLEVRSTIE
jgi:hypothetical protein